MINPSFQIQDELYIHAASQSVWQTLSRLQEWPLWNTEIVAAAWVAGSEWKEGSIFQLRHHTFLGRQTTTSAVVRMCVPGSTVVWESQSAGLTVVNSASFADDLGGCRLTARHTYHGLPSLLLRLLGGRQRRLLGQAMGELKTRVEGESR